MPTGALLLALAAAVVHAGWNLLLAGASETRNAAAAQLLVSMLVWSVPALALWRVEGDAVPYLLAGAALQAAYFGLLVAAYEAGELSLVYPLARGGAPVLVLLVAAAGAGGHVTAVQGLGIVVVGAGVVAVRGVRGPWRGRDTLLAGATAATIAGYTVLDRYGVRHANPVTYVWLELVPSFALMTGLAWRRNGPRAIRGAVGRASIAAGVGGLGSYALVLAALKLASAAPVSAVRESSVVIAVGLAALVLGERVTRARMAGAVAVAAGTALVAVG